MAIRLTDADIASLIAEAKHTTILPFGSLPTRLKNAHREYEINVTGANGNEFQVRIRQGTINPLDFSVILMHQLPNSKEWIRLRRYNGNNHRHQNSIENQLVTGFHRHSATERYQQIGAREDGFAEPMTSYADLQSALNVMKAECGFVASPIQQTGLFEDEE